MQLNSRNILLSLGILCILGAVAWLALGTPRAENGDTTRTESPDPAETATGTESEDETIATAGDTEADDAAAGAEAQTSDGYTDIVLGNPDASLAVIEYVSMTCPACAHFHKEVFKKFRKEYLDTGRAHYRLRHYVLNGPDLAASMLARCAPKSRYYAMIDLFFKRQDDWLAPWQKLEQPAADARLSDLALEAGMDDFVRPAGFSRDRVVECLDDDAIRMGLMRQRDEGQRSLNVNQTPTIVINGRIYTGKHTFEEFDKALRAREKR